MNVERAAKATLDAYRIGRQWPGRTVMEQHGICGYGCGCKRRPNGWPKIPPVHPRDELCHAAAEPQS